MPIAAPTITDYPSKLNSNQELIVKGRAQADGRVTVFWQRGTDQAEQKTVASDAAGDFIFIGPQLENGVYRLWAEAVDNRGARSYPSEKIIITVEKTSLVQFSSWAVNVLAIIIPLVSLLIVLIFLVWWGWYKFSHFRKKLRKRVRRTEAILLRAFNLLRQDLKAQVKLLEKTKAKRKLTAEEQKVCLRLKKDLLGVEKIIKKEIEGIEEEVD